MATVLYLESSGTAGASPAAASGWERSADMDRVAGPTLTKLGTAMTSKTAAGNGNATNDDSCARQYVSALLAATTFTIGDTVSVQVRCRESIGTDNYTLAVGIRILQADGTTLSTLKTVTVAAGTEMSASALTNRTWSLTLVGGYVGVGGERLVIEIGMRCTSGTATNNATFSFGSDGASDLPVDESTTTALNPTITFPNTITFSGAVPVQAAAHRAMMNRIN